VNPGGPRTVRLELIGGLAAIFVLGNLWASRAVLRDELSSSKQRAAQLLFVWLVPVVGVLLTLYLKRITPEATVGHYRDEPDPGADYSASAQGVQHLQRGVESELPATSDSGETG
jgi:hypothetical protein